MYCSKCKYGGIRFILLWLYYLVFTTGLFLISISIFVSIGPFTNSEPELFQSSGVLLGLQGAVFTVLGIFCAQALIESDKKYANGCTGLAPMSVAQLCITAMIPPLIVLLAGSNYVIEHFDNVRSDLRSFDDDAESAQYASYIDAEVFIRNRFNAIFFDGVQQCDGEAIFMPSFSQYIKHCYSVLPLIVSQWTAAGSFSWFWSWVNEYCEDDIGEHRCEKCFDVSITFCRADQDTCYSENDQGVGRACPYTLCRENFADFIVETVAT